MKWKIVTGVFQFLCLPKVSSRLIDAEAETEN